MKNNDTFDKKEEKKEKSSGFGITMAVISGLWLAVLGIILVLAIIYMGQYFRR